MALPAFAIWEGIWSRSFLCERKFVKGSGSGLTLFSPGRISTGSHRPFSLRLWSQMRAEGADDVDSLVAKGVDFIKVQSILDRVAYFSIAQEAKREHISFVGHVPDRVTAAEASDAGQRSIEHLTGVLRACSGDEAKLMREQFAPGPKNQTPLGSHEREDAWSRELLATQSEKTCGS